jgi:hypothetical protein
MFIIINNLYENFVKKISVRLQVTYTKIMEETRNEYKCLVGKHRKRKFKKGQI